MERRMEKHSQRGMETKSWRRIEICVLFFVVITIIIISTVWVTRRHNTVMPKLSVDINIVNVELKSDMYASPEGMVYPIDTIWKVGGHTFACTCSVKQCIQKCCDENEVYSQVTINTTKGMVEDMMCVEENVPYTFPNREVFFNRGVTENSTNPVSVGDTYFYIFHAESCDKIRMFTRTLKIVSLTEHTRFYTFYPYIDQSQYCLEILVNESASTRRLTFKCAPQTDVEEVRLEEQEKWIYLVLIGGMFFSIPCLALTLVVYLILPNLQDLKGKCLMSHVVCLIVAYVTLACVQFPGSPIKPNNPSCKLAALVIQYSFLACFCWLNVMCYDLWRVFSGRMTVKESGNPRELCRFIKYSAYAWGVPFLAVALTVFMDDANPLPYFLRPKIGVHSCWFYGSYARIMYFHLPVGVLITINIWMFSTTFCRIYSQNKNVGTLNNTDSQRHNGPERRRFYIYLNLFIVMGITWVMEVLSFAIGGPRVYWIFTDLANSLQGVFIFVIFVCKRRIFYQLNQRVFPPAPLIAPTHSKNHNGSRSTTSRL